MKCDTCGKKLKEYHVEDFGFCNDECYKKGWMCKEVPQVSIGKQYKLDKTGIGVCPSCKKKTLRQTNAWCVNCILWLWCVPTLTGFDL